MDFEIHYTDQQQRFREALRAWLDDNMPKDLDIPADGRPLNKDTQQKVKDFRCRLGEKGWLAPSWPLEWGGGGLHPELEEVFLEEIRRLNLPSIGNTQRWIPPLLIWGSPEQKERYVPPALRGETIVWQLFSELETGSDLASIQTHAVRDGQEWVINGSKAFVLARFDPDYLWTLAVTDVTRPEKLNLGVFMIDAATPGISIRSQDLLLGSDSHIELDDVRVPGECLIGHQYQGWEIAQATIGSERGGYMIFRGDDETVRSVQEFLRQQGKEEA